MIYIYIYGRFHSPRLHGREAGIELHVTTLQHPLFSSTTETEGEENRYSSCWGNRVSFVFDFHSAFDFDFKSLFAFSQY